MRDMKLILGTYSRAYYRGSYPNGCSIGGLAAAAVGDWGAWRNPRALDIISNYCVLCMPRITLIESVRVPI